MNEFKILPQKKSHAHSGFFGMYVACGWVWKNAISFGYREKVIPRLVDRGLRPLCSREPSQATPAARQHVADAVATRRGSYKCTSASWANGLRPRGRGPCVPIGGAKENKRPAAEGQGAGGAGGFSGARQGWTAIPQNYCLLCLLRSCTARSIRSQTAANCKSTSRFWKRSTWIPQSSNSIVRAASYRIASSE